MQYTQTEARRILNRHRYIDDWTGSRFTLNLYRGCEHSCAYCDGRSEKYRVEGDFGENIQIKLNAIELLQRELASLREPAIISTGGVGDIYQPAEREYSLTRRFLELILEYGQSVHIVTKSSLILRDIDIIRKIAKESKAIVSVSISTLNERVCKVFEPSTAFPRERLKVLEAFAKEGIPTGVWFMPIIPGVCDDERRIEEVVSACADVGADFILPSTMTLKEGAQREYFMGVLKTEFPELLSFYQKIYQKNRWGAPITEYRERIENIASSICHRHRIPTRVPYRLIKDRVPLRDEIALILSQIAYLLELKGKRGIAYRKAGFEIQKSKISSLTDRKGLLEIPNVGERIASVICEIARNRKCELYEELWEEAYKV